jgi:hypothetical protein
VAHGIGSPAAWPRRWRSRRYRQAARCDGPMPRRAAREVVCAAFVCFSNWAAQASQRAASWFQLARSSGLAVERAILRHSSACRRNSAAGSIFRSHLIRCLAACPQLFKPTGQGVSGSGRKRKMCGPVPIRAEASPAERGPECAFEDVGAKGLLAVMANRAQRDCPPRRCTLRAAMTRLGRVISGPDVLYRGIWPTYFSAPFGIAAVAARLRQLDANQTAHALALALTLARARRRPPQRSDHVAFHVALVRRRQHRPQRIDRRPCGAIRLHIRPWASGLGLLRQYLRHRAQPVGVDGRLGRRASRSRRNPAPTSGASSMFPGTRIARSTGHGSRTNSAAWSLLCLRANRRTTWPGELSKAWTTANR